MDFNKIFKNTIKIIGLDNFNQLISGQGNEAPHVDILKAINDCPLNFEIPFVKDLAILELKLHQMEVNERNYEFKYIKEEKSFVLNPNIDFFESEYPIAEIYKCCEDPEILKNDPDNEQGQEFNANRYFFIISKTGHHMDIISIDPIRFSLLNGFTQSNNIKKVVESTFGNNPPENIGNLLTSFVENNWLTPIEYSKKQLQALKP